MGAEVFGEWNKGDLDSFLIEITANIFKKRDDIDDEKENYLVDQVLDKTGQKGTGLWTVKESAQQGIACPTISAALTARNLSALKAERLDAAKVFQAPKMMAVEDKKKFVDEVKTAL